MIAESIQREIPSYKYNAVMVHGAGIEGDRPGHDGRMRVIGASQVWAKRESPIFILSGGHTSGLKNPSEAYVMQKFLLGINPNISITSLMLEELSITTAGNIRAFIEMQSKYGWTDVAYITNRYHQAYVEKLARNYGLSADVLTAEDLMIEMNPDYRKEIDEYYQSDKMTQTMRSQRILRALLKVDPLARIPEYIASRTRN